MKRYFIVYEGRVQGVGFRWKLMNYARELNLTGYCKNLDNGNVTCEIQGENVDEFLKRSLKGDQFVKVYDYTIKELPLNYHDSDFTVEY